MDIKTKLWAATRAAEHVGFLVRGLAVLKETGGEFLLISGEHPAERLDASTLEVRFEGVFAHGRRIIAFDDRLSSWESDRGEPCISWEDEGVRSLIAPGTALDPDDIARTVATFADKGPMPGDQVWMGDLNRSLGSGDQLLLVDGVLTARGETFALTDMTWAQADSDGDGNEFLHIVMKDGRYREIAIGDLTR